MIDSDLQKICEGAYTWIKIDITLVNPFPVRGKHTGSPEARFEGIILDAFTNAAFDLELDDVEPTEAAKRLVCGILLSLHLRNADNATQIRSRAPQFRSEIKKIARSLVVQAYGLRDLSSLPNPTTTSIAAAVEANRKLVAELLTTFVYQVSALCCAAITFFNLWHGCRTRTISRLPIRCSPTESSSGSSTQAGSAQKSATAPSTSRARHSWNFSSPWP